LQDEFLKLNQKKWGINLKLGWGIKLKLDNLACRHRIADNKYPRTHIK
jgi:hypothetical protein